MRRSSAFALVVGTLLNAINQGDVLLGGGELDLIKLVLTYLVPFAVSTHGAYSMACISAHGGPFRTRLRSRPSTAGRRR